MRSPLSRRPTVCLHILMEYMLDTIHTMRNIHEIPPFKGDYRLRGRQTKILLGAPIFQSNTLVVTSVLVSKGLLFPRLFQGLRVSCHSKQSEKHPLVLSVTEAPTIVLSPGVSGLGPVGLCLLSSGLSASSVPGPADSLSFPCLGYLPAGLCSPESSFSPSWEH